MVCSPCVNEKNVLFCLQGISFMHFYSSSFFFVYVSVLCFVSIGCDSPLFSAALLVAMQPVVF